MLQGHELILQRIGKVLRAQDDDITHEPVPTCWVAFDSLPGQARAKGARSAVNRKLSGAFRARRQI